MRLTYASIRNFRSIHDLRIDFSPNCQILVGINESGKSNILDALSMLSNEFDATKKDVREPHPDDPPIDKAYVKFVFSLDSSEINQLYEEIKKVVLCKSVEKEPILEYKNKKLTLKDFCALRNEGIYHVDIMKNQKGFRYWTLNPNYKVLSNWKSPTADCPPSYLVESKKGSTANLNKYTLININDYDEIPAEYLDDIDTDIINSIVGREITAILKKSLPDTIYWKYSEQNLLPPSIPISDFTSDPDICAPLKNMFILSGIDEDDIPNEIENAQQGARTGLMNLLNRIAKNTTKHFHSIWGELRGIEFDLRESGTDIIASVKDTFNLYELAQRSDGFKRFITFLLMISTKVKAMHMDNTLILIDEPDISLHPSGARFLRDELINIAENNYVIYSTHSVFMIDPENINRHLMISKKDEITHVNSADNSDIFDEEVIYNALRFSIWAMLKQENILFEGWRDKKLFKTAISRIPSEYKHLKTLKSIGTCHAKGVKDITRITPLFEAASRKCLILSDNDKPAKEKQKEFNKNKGYGDWKRYDEIFKEGIIITSEDFISNETLIGASKQYSERYSSLDELSDEILSNANGKLKGLHEWLRDGGIEIDDAKKIIDEIKDNIFNDLKPSHIEKRYYDFLDRLSKHINK